MVKDEPESFVQFHSFEPPRDYEPSTFSSMYGPMLEPDPFDFTIYMDQVRHNDRLAHWR